MNSKQQVMVLLQVIAAVYTIVGHDRFNGLFASAFLPPRGNGNTGATASTRAYLKRHKNDLVPFSETFSAATAASRNRILGLNPSKRIHGNASDSLFALRATLLPCWSVANRLTRTDAQALLNQDDLLPSSAYGDRKTLGLKAAEQECGGDLGGNDEDAGVILADDPRLARTYAEFPLASLDVLLDAAVGHLSSGAGAGGSAIQMVDIGSGLGRIVLYSALTRHGRGAGETDTGEESWRVCGIEISSVLHNGALELVDAGMGRELFRSCGGDPGREDECKGDPSFLSKSNKLSFHLGSATEPEGSALLGSADIVFSYSTVFKAKYFDPDVGALLLDAEEWSRPLGEACKPGCVAVTTDRALDPRFGWKLVERIDVPNPDVLGTTGFVHVLETNEQNESEAMGTSQL